MRLRYPYDLSDSEETELANLRRAINQWWKNFANRSEDLVQLFNKKQTWDLPAWMNENLSPIYSDLMWEYGQGLLGGHRLVITPESDRNIRPLVAEILRSAPAIDGWEFYAFRLPEDAVSARSMVEARNGERLDDMRFIFSHGDFNRVDVRCLVCKDYPVEKSKATGFVALETLLGEELLDRWIGYIDHEQVDEFPSNCIPAENVLAAVRRVVTEIQSKLPSDVWSEHVDEVEWSLCKLKPAQESTDHPKRRDQVSQVSAYPELHKCALNNVPFDSVRFSNCDETFVYIKIDGSEGLPEWGFADRGEIEDALITALGGCNLGTVIGGGTGLRYTYIDLALMDVNKAVPVIRETLWRGGVSLRSWLLFFDSYLEDEWIGIFSDSPPPPLEMISE